MFTSFARDMTENLYKKKYDILPSLALHGTLELLILVSSSLNFSWRVTLLFLFFLSPIWEWIGRLTSQYLRRETEWQKQYSGRLRRGGEMGFMAVLGEIVPSTSMVMVEGSTIGLTILASTAISKGMSPFVFVVYTNAIGSIILLPYSFLYDRNTYDLNLLHSRRLRYLLFLYWMILFNGIWNEIDDSYWNKFFFLTHNCIQNHATM